MLSQGTFGVAWRAAPGAAGNARSDPAGCSSVQQRFRAAAGQPGHVDSDRGHDAEPTPLTTWSRVRRVRRSTAHDPIDTTHFGSGIWS
jgi:hypothetical protein